MRSYVECFVVQVTEYFMGVLTDRHSCEPLHVAYAAGNLRWESLLRASEVVGDHNRYLAGVRVAALHRLSCCGAQFSVSD